MQLAIMTKYDTDTALLRTHMAASTTYTYK